MLPKPSPTSLWRYVPFIPKFPRGRTVKIIELFRPRVRSVPSLTQFNNIMSLLLHGIRCETYNHDYIDTFSSLSPLSIITISPSPSWRRSRNAAQRSSVDGEIQKKGRRHYGLALWYRYVYDSFFFPDSSFADASLATRTSAAPLEVEHCIFSSTIVVARSSWAQASDHSQSSKDSSPDRRRSEGGQ